MEENFSSRQLSGDIERQAIMDIQRYLRQLSLEDPAFARVAVDGIYGAETVRAVEEFQRLSGLEVTGRVDRITWDRLFEEYTMSLYRNSFPAPFPVFPMNPVGYTVSVGERSFLVSVIQYLLSEIAALYGDSTLSTDVNGEYSDSTAEAVKALQRIFGLEVRYLRQLSLEDPAFARVAVDGIYGAETVRAVEEFQRLSGLEVTGRVDRITWDRLFEEYTMSLYRNSFPAPFPVFPMNPVGYTVSVGERSFLVSVIQYLLSEIAALYGDSTLSTDVNGEYSDSTAEAVKALQRIFGLEVTGEVDRVTWDALIDAYGVAFGQVKQ